MESKSHALAAGVFVLAVLGLLIALAAWLMSDNAATVDYEMATRDAVTGLQVQAPVRYKGVAVGKVTAINFSPQGEVRVRLAVSPDTPVTQATYATLNLQGVTGLSFVQLDDGGASGGAPLAAGPNGIPRIPLRPGLLSIMGDRAEAFAEKATLAIDRFNQLLDDDNQSSIAATLAETATAMRSLNKLLERSDIPALVRESSDTLRSVRTAVDRAGKTIDNLGAVTGEAKTALRTFTGETKTALRGLTAREGTIARLNSSIDTLATDTLPRISRLTDDASRTLRHLDDVAGQLKANPQALLYGNGHPAPGPGEHGFAPRRP